MLYANFKQVLDMDSKINELHLELTNLYAERNTIINQQSPTNVKFQSKERQTANNLPVSAPVNTEDYTGYFGHELSAELWVDKEYKRLHRIWEKYNVKIPEKKKLESRLTKAYEIISSINQLSYRLSGNLQAILVPPANKLNFPITASLRQKQSAKSSVGDTIILNDMPVYKSRSWRVLVCYTSSEGMYFGSPEYILENNKFFIAGYDMRALGVVEYASLSLQVDKPIDRNTWSLLLKDFDKDKDTTVYSANFNGQAYTFSTAEADSIFGVDCFRPAIEIS